jgi:hypothetical protein
MKLRGEHTKGLRVTRRATLVILLVTGSILPIAASALRADRPAADPQDDGTNHRDVLLGDDLAVSLGLTKVTSFPVIGCRYFAESHDDVGYCLDDVVDSPHDAEMLSIQITGRQPTTLDEQIFNIGQQLSALPDGSQYDDQRRELSLEMQQLLEQQQQRSG